MGFNSGFKGLNWLYSFRSSIHSLWGVTLPVHAARMGWEQQTQRAGVMQKPVVTHQLIALNDNQKNPT